MARYETESGPTKRAENVFMLVLHAAIRTCGMHTSSTALLHDLLLTMWHGDCISCSRCYTAPLFRLRPTVHN